MDDLVTRWTVWQTEDGDPLQMELAVLDAQTWDALASFVKPCGPFHGVDERRIELHDDMRRWLATCGIQGELSL